MDARWKEIERLFSSHGLAPRDLFEPPATEEAIAELRSATSLSLPAQVETFYRIHNGQRLGVPGVIFGIELLSIERIIENWRNWEAISEDGLNEELADSMSSNPPDFIKPVYVNLRWLPLTHDQSGNHLGMDFDPGPRGTSGQIIAFGRDDDEKKLVAPSFGRFIDMFIEELTAIDWTLDLQSGWRINDAQRGQAHYHDWPRSSHP